MKSTRNKDDDYFELGQLYAEWRHAETGDLYVNVQQKKTLLDEFYDDCVSNYEGQF